MKTSMEAGSAAVERNSWVRAAQVFLWMLIPAGAVMAQTPPFQETTTLSTDADPIESDFSIPQSGAGQYKITLTDLGAKLPDPPAGPGKAPLDSVHVVITRGTTVVVKLDGNIDKTVAVSTVLFDATPGTYKAHIAGKPGAATGSGPVGLKITSVASSTTTVLDLSGSLAAPQTTQPDLRSYQTDIDVPADGDYTLTLADLEFPRAGALETAGAFLLQAGAPSLSACLNIPAIPTVCESTQTVHLTAGHYQLVVAGALLSGADAGVFAMQVTSVATGAVIHSRRVELGTVKRLSESALQLSAGSHTLSFKDLLFPVSLSAGSAMVATGAQSAATVDAVTIDKAFTVPATSTAYDVFAYAAPDATAATGSYAVEVKPVSGPVALSVVQAIGDPASTARAFVFPVDLTAAGTYRTKFGDFQFPVALSGSRIAVVQNGAIAGKTDAATGTALSLDTPLVTGRATVIAVAKAAGSGALAQSGGTFGLEMATVGATQPVFEATQGVGGLVSVRKISVTSAGHYDVTIADINAPSTFNDLMLVASRGSQKLFTLVVGSGGSNPQADSATYPDFDATAGNYSFTLIATPNATSHASTYGLSMATSPPAPTLTLTATPATVSSGATVGLSWTSQGATSCTATSSPAAAWSGSKSTSGSDASGPITTATTFTLKCTDSAGRSTEKMASVTVAAQNNDNGGGGGGGAFDWLTVLALTLVGAVHIGRRSRRLQMTDL
jgi:hypothetical protein